MHNACPNVAAYDKNSEYTKCWLFTSKTVALPKPEWEQSNGNITI